MTDVQVSETPTTETPATETPATEKPVRELLTDMTSEIGTLLRKEVELAVSELRDEARQAAKAGGMLSGGALSGYFSLLFASFGVAWFLDKKLPRPMSFFLVAGLHGAAAAALLTRGREEMLRVNPVPTQTMESVKESAEILTGQAG